MSVIVTSSLHDLQCM